MPGRFRFRMRNLRIAPRCFAIALILLIVLPFTAPFASCDFSSLIGESAAQGSSLDVKTMKEETTTPFVASTVIDLALGTIVRGAALTSYADVRSLPLAVLRV